MKRAGIVIVDFCQEELETLCIESSKKGVQSVDRD